MNKYPVNKIQFQRQVASIMESCKTNSPMMRIAPLVKMRCELLLRAYYGGQRKMVWALFKDWLRQFRHDINSRFEMWICDTIGWTKLYHIPADDKWIEHGRRHGRNCPCILKVPPSPTDDCGMDCIQGSIPKWFKWLTRRKDLE